LFYYQFLNINMMTQEMWGAGARAGGAGSAHQF